MEFFSLEPYLFIGKQCQKFSDFEGLKCFFGCVLPLDISILFGIILTSSSKSVNSL